MAGGVVVQGNVERVPGLYGVPGRSTIGGNTTSVGNLGVVGEYPSLEQNVPALFPNKESLLALDPTNIEWARFADICWNPASDGRIGGIGSLTLVNAQPCTQASYTFPSANTGNSVAFKAKRWGAKGNATYVRLTSKGPTSKLVDAYVSANGTSESYPNIGSGSVVQFDNSLCTDLTTGGSSTVTVGNDNATFDGTPDGICNKLTWSWVKALQTADGATGTFTKLVINGKITAKALVADAGSGHTLIVTAVGLDASGASLTAARTFTNPTLNQELVLQVGGVDAVFSRLDTVTWANGGGGVSTAPSISANAFVLQLTPTNGFTYVKDIATFLNNYNAKGWALTVLQPQIAQIPANQLDARAAVDTFGAVAPFRADVWSLINTLAVSKLVTCARVTGAQTSGVDMPAPWNQTADVKVDHALISGTETAISSVSTQYAASLQMLETEDIQSVVVESDSIDAGTALAYHLNRAALAGSERNGYFGAPNSTSLATIYSTYVTALNDRGVSVAGQQILMSNPLTGAKEYLDTFWQAVQQASMQCGRNVGIPLTNKKPRILGTQQNWTPGLDDDTVIKNGIYAYTKGNTGYKVLRSITSWVSDDFVPYEEVSANESFNFSIRDCRNQLTAKIGDPADITPSQFVGVIKTILDAQVAAKQIRAYDPTSVRVVQVGDVYNIYYRVAPMLPFNFGLLFVDAYTFTAAA